MSKQLALATIKSLDGMADQIKQILPRSVPVDRFLRTAKQAIQQNPDLVEVTTNGEPKVNRQSLYSACLAAARDGLILDNREAALVIFKGQAQYMPMVGGLIKLARSHAGVKALAAVTVRANDEFHYDPASGSPPMHGVEWFGERGEIIGYYAVIHYQDGLAEAAVMTVAEVEKIAGLARTDRIWKQWPEQMGQKTVLRRLLRRAQLSETEDALEHEDDRYDEPVVDVTPEPEPAPAIEHEAHETTAAAVVKKTRRSAQKQKTEAPPQVPGEGEEVLQTPEEYAPPPEEMKAAGQDGDWF